MRLVDLFVKLANGEEVPKKIRFDGTIFIYTKDFRYENEKNSSHILENDLVLEELNSEIEIIDVIDIKPKHIEEVKEIIRYQDLEAPYGHNESMFMRRIIMQQNKIDEIIKAVNYLLDKEETDEKNK